MKKFKPSIEQKRAQFTRKNGVYLTIRMYKNYLIELFAVEHFFVEIWYYQHEDELRIKTKTYNDIGFLDKYLNDELSFSILKSI
jgi:hypothetical protein